MIESSDKLTQLPKALVKAQAAIGKALKNENNPFHRSTYADLEAIIDAVKPPLNDHGFSFLQTVGCDGNGGATVTTVLLHESGEWIRDTAPVYLKKVGDPQAFGSGVTYTKRYALQAMLGVPSADDDAEGAMGRGGNGERQNTSPQQGNTNGRPHFSQPTEQRQGPRQNKGQSQAALPPTAPGQGTPLAKLSHHQKRILATAFDAFTGNHQCPPDYVWDKKAFVRAVERHFGAMPTRNESVPKILEALTVAEVIVPKSEEDGTAAAAGTVTYKGQTWTI
jgi:hypothetical protein